MNTKAQLKSARRADRTKRTDATDGAVSNETLLDKVAVADRLGVRPRTVGQWARQGKIPAYRIGNYLRFKWAEIETHLAQSCRVEANAEG